MISMNIKKKLITKNNRNSSTYIFNHNVIKKNKNQKYKKYYMDGLNDDKTPSMEFFSLYEIIIFLTNQDYHLLYIKNYKIVFLKNKEELDNLISNNTLTCKICQEHINKVDCYNHNQEPRKQPKRRQRLKTPNEEEEEEKCKKCTFFLKKNCQKPDVVIHRPEPTEQPTSKRINSKRSKNNESHYQNPVQSRPTINPRKTHKGQTYAMLSGNKKTTQLESQDNGLYNRLSKTKKKQS